MPKRTDIRTILIIGSGPIVIGQGCEFDYSGTQACKALKEEGFAVVLVNSNPATIMTDPQFADRTYIEPITPETVAKIIAKEHGGQYQIDVLLPTLGGQTALNCACQLYDDGTLKRFGIEMIGATRDVIHRAEDRDQFRKTIESIGLKCPRTGIAKSIEQAWNVLEQVQLPAIIRPAFTLGGTGGGIAYNREEFEDVARRGLDASMTRQIIIDQSLIGWKEFELEVMRDCDDNVVIICSIENFDPMGVHTGDSITVAPVQTLTDKEYQRMRDAAMAIIRAIGVETGGSNIQFAVNPDDGEMIVIEMNPRVSRSSALASKATGFPIAKIAAKLAVGYTLWELPNDITGKTVACFEPTIDYVVTKIPRWTFEKFPDADETLTIQMKSVGEAMSIARTFKESLQKGIRSMEVKRFGLGLDAMDKWLGGLRGGSDWPIDEAKLRRKLSVPSQGRLYYLRYAMKMGWSIRQIAQLTHIDPWFLDQIQQLVDFEQVLLAYKELKDVPREVLFEAKQLGYSDAQLANLYLGTITTETVLRVRRHRQALGIDPVYKLVDTCAAEFEATTPYYYSTYESPIHHVHSARPTPAAPTAPGSAGGQLSATRDANPPAEPGAAGVGGHEAAGADDEIRVTDRKKIIILGGGPNRIGQGIEFDYCCVQAAFAAAELGFESVMINSNPETVSTDYDTSDLLFFEPLTLEDVLNICERLNGAPLGDPAGKLLGVIVQFGGQTPLNLAHGLEAAGVPIIGTSVDSIDLAEDRERFQKLLHELGLKQPDNGIAFSLEQAIQIANRIGYPVMVRPSYVLGGRGMETCFAEKQLVYYMKSAVDVSELAHAPVLIDRFLAEAIEVDVDLVADFGAGIRRSGFAAMDVEVDLRTEPRSPKPSAIVCGVMEHIEEAGIHSGDSACVIPPHSLPAHVVQRIKEQTYKLAQALEVRGLMNVQYAIKRGREQGTEGSRDQGTTEGTRDQGTKGPRDQGIKGPRDQGTKGPRDQGTTEGSRTYDATSNPSVPSYDIYVLEVNPRASRTVPFVSKATGVSWARIAAKVMAGRQLCELGITDEVTPLHTSVKESVFPFNMFPGVDVILGPEMRSTGEVMGIDPGFPIAFAKAQMAAGTVLPTEGKIFLSVRDSDKPLIVKTARQLQRMGFALVTTRGVHRFLYDHGIETEVVNKISEGRPHAADLIANHEVALVINTPTRKGINTDEGRLRATAVRFNVPMITTITAAAAAVQAITALQLGQWDVRALQDYHPTERPPTKARVFPARH